MTNEEIIKNIKEATKKYLFQAEIDSKDTFYIISIKEYEVLKEKSMLKTLVSWNTLVYDSSIGECKLYKLNKETLELEPWKKN